jgi:GNAT superfamily N-acetyltransferase
VTADLRRLDRYLDAVPRSAAEVVDVGHLRAFVSSAPWPYYVRPRAELDLVAPLAVTADDVRRSATVLAAAGQGVSFEWVHELVPSLEPVLVEEGYAVVRYPLLQRGLEASDPVAIPDTVAVLDADSPDVPAALAVADVAFAMAGTAVGRPGPAARDRQVSDVPPATVDHVRRQIRTGALVVAVHRDPVDGVVAVGSHQPVGAETEVVGVATLPSHRRRGLAGGVVCALLADAAANGVTLALLSAGGDDVARVYERVGFVRVGTSGAAERPPTAVAARTG